MFYLWTVSCHYWLFHLFALSFSVYWFVIWFPSWLCWCQWMCFVEFCQGTVSGSCFVLLLLHFFYFLCKCKKSYLLYLTKVLVCWMLVCFCSWFFFWFCFSHCFFLLKIEADIMDSLLFVVSGGACHVGGHPLPRVACPSCWLWSWYTAGRSISSFSL